MKTYILRDPKSVERQNRGRPVRPARRAAASPLPGGRRESVLYIGLDVHNDSIAVSLAASDTSEVRRYGLIGGSHDDVLKLKLFDHAGASLKFYYEAGPRGYRTPPRVGAALQKRRLD